MSLTVLVKSASNLPNVEKFSKSDPMCVIILQGEFHLPFARAAIGVRFKCSPATLLLDMLVSFFAGEKKKTKVIDNNLDPEWNEVNFRKHFTINLVSTPLLINNVQARELIFSSSPDPLVAAASCSFGLGDFGGGSV